MSKNKRYLLVVEDDKCLQGQLRWAFEDFEVVISGDRPIDLIAADTDRLVGIDGRLEDLDREDRPATLVPLISDRWGKQFRWHGGSDMPENERQQLREIIRIAHARGQRVRFWATPEDPACWRELAAGGVDLIGTDRLGDLARFLEEQPGQ